MPIEISVSNMAETSLIPAIITNASGPQSMSGDGISVNSQQATQQIEAEKFVQGSVALGTRRFGMQVQQYRPGSALGGHRR